MIFIAVELVLLFAGVNVFREKVLVFGKFCVLFLVASLHFVGAILGAMFTFLYWEFDFNWVLWFLFRYLSDCFFSFIPLFTEIVTICTTPRKTL